MTAPRRNLDPAQREVLEQATALLSDFDARHGPLLDDVLAAITDFLALIRARVMGFGLTAIDLDQFPEEDRWVYIAHTRLDKHITEAFTAAYLQVLDRATGATGDAIVNVDPFIQHHIETVSDRLRDWPRGVFEDIREELHESVAAGESTAQLTDRIGAVLDIDAPSHDLRRRITALGRDIAAAPDRATAQALKAERAALYSGMQDTDYAWRWRADRIARTELTTALNGGEHHAQIALSAATGERTRKQWLATPDANTRLSHAAANGQTRDLTDPFDVGGHPLMFPGDPSGPAGETIQCRCTTLYLPPGTEPLPELGPIGEPAGMEAAMTATATETAPAKPLPDGWIGPMTPLGTPAGDSRIIADPGAGLQVRPLPLPLLAQERLAEGHEGAVVVGLVEKVWIEDGALWGCGRFDLEDPEAARWARRLRDGFAGWVSVGLDAATMTEMMYRPADGDLKELELVPHPDAELGELVDERLDPTLPEGYTQVFVADPWRLMSLTLLAQSAFPDDARVTPIWNYTGTGTGETTMASNEFAPPPFPPKAENTKKPPPKTGDDEDRGWVPQVGDRVVVDDPSAGGPGEVTAVDTSVDPVIVTVQLDAGGPVEVEVSKVKPEAPTASAADDGPPPTSQASAFQTAVRSVLAAAAPAPDRSWFNDPGLAEPTPLTVGDDGRVFGHLALWDTCHVGIPGTCTTPPRTATNYALFHVGEVQCAGGELVPVGKLTLGTGHADPEAGFRAAADHYDNTGTAVAVVHAYEDDHGIAVAGALCPDATGDQVAALRRSPLSGDWRRIAGNLELIAALCVNVPGFPVRRPTIAASIGDLGQQISLVAAGTVTPTSWNARTYPALAAAIADALAEREHQTRRADAAKARLAEHAGSPLWAHTRAALATMRVRGADTGLAVKAAQARGYNEGS